ncbi:H-2 class I histocompatibility antigen, Q10 alpha chain-like [Erinaceus europaeus]|uniref:H-2 class I histocompatibility antigen, Q10 alpha chain-like n=1 Tax=Erinaceus europaeus TaxID=9365 RepID=A0ABM3XX51_ERIEU|nr:H-2 class I histocompatibility antigen, Q10 alpha chain-like [Erinaceus europaeus]
MLLLCGLLSQCAAESLWRLPSVEDDPTYSAKIAIAELADLKFDSKPWPGGTHTLYYHYLALSEPVPHLPQFMAVGYMNDQPFIKFDSHEGRAKPQAPWMEAMDAQYWEKETQKQQGWALLQPKGIWRVMGYYNHSGGIHSTHFMIGCEIQEDGSSRGFWQFGYDGEDHLTLDMDTQSWVPGHPLALQTKRWWDQKPCYAEYDKAYLDKLCLPSLHRYLELGGHSLTRKELPTVQVTRHLAQDGDATLRCWARGFYPRDISVSWWLGEEELSQETEWVETRPSGDGTYQTWAAVRVPQGKETQYNCRVQHSGLSQVLTVAWESPSSAGLLATVISIVAIALLAVLGTVYFIKVKSQARGNKDSYQQAPGDCEIVGGEEAPAVHPAM